MSSTEQSRRWYEANREQILERQRRYRQTHPERVRQQNRKSGRRYYQAHPERSKARSRRWREARPGRAMWKAHGLRPEGWWALWTEQDGRCYLCGDPLPENGDYHAVVVEHDHRHCPPGRSCAVCRRGLACLCCNRLIGLARDDPKRLSRVAANLARAKRRVTANLRRAQRQGAAQPQLALFDPADLTTETETETETEENTG